MSPTRRSVLKLAAAAPVAALVPAAPVAAEPEIVLEHRFDADAVLLADDAAGRPLLPALMRPVRCAWINGTWVLIPGRELVAELDAVAGLAPRPIPPTPLEADVFMHAYVDGERCFGRVIFSRNAAGRWRAEGEDGHVSACPRDADPLAWALDQFEEQHAVQEARSAAGGTDPA